MDDLSFPDIDGQARILIADDEDFFLKPTAGILRARGFECDCVQHAQAAEEHLIRNNYDLLIIDINMPGNENLEFLRDRSQDSSFLPIIIVTGYPSLDTALECFRLSVVDYITKPITSSDLLKAVRSAIQTGRALRKMQTTRRDFSMWLEQMKGMETSLLLKQPSGVGGGRHGTLDWYLDETVRQFANISLSLISTIRTLKQSSFDRREDICTLMNCPRLSDYKRGIQDAVDVLVQTKNSFKSKELGELRKRLETLLQS